MAVTGPFVLRDYALVADGERGILVDPRGEYCWMCFPGWDSDAVFAGLIGGGGGYRVTPADRSVWGGYYEPGSLIWRSRWVISGGGVVECREALALPARTDRAVSLRRVIADQGEARLEISLEPAAGFGAQTATELTRGEGGEWTGRAGDLWFRWSGDGVALLRPKVRGGALNGQLRLPEGSHADLVLEWSTTPFEDEPPEPDLAWQVTAHSWQRAVPELEHTLAPRDARQAYAVLWGLTGHAGGMVAAATTSLPERADEGENYDYRYAWIRDQCFSGQALAVSGQEDLLERQLGFVVERLLADGPRLHPVYTAAGGKVPAQRVLQLPGYPGGHDTVGNHAYQQFQLDSFGEILLLLAEAGRLDRLDADRWQAVQTATDAIAKRWREPDAGIWELNNAHWTHSRLICAAGLRAVAGLAPQASGAPWLALADTIVAETAATALHPSGRWQRAADDPRLDAALLLPPLRGALPADDPRTVATLQAYRAELTKEGYAYRFRHDGRPLYEAEGAFLFCGFTLALALQQHGDRVEAGRCFERHRSACGSPGLFTEEFDVIQRQLRGNLPQAFVHALMLESAARLADLPGA